MKKTFILNSHEVSQALGEYLVEIGELDMEDFDTDIVNIIFIQRGDIITVEVSDNTEKKPLN